MSHKMPLHFLIPILMLVLLSACTKKGDNTGDEQAQDPSSNVTVNNKELAAMNESDSNIDIVEIVPGLEMKRLKSGDGSAAASGDMVEVHYTGWNFDPTAADGRGTKFDSSVDRGDRFQFPLGAGRVIRGWDLGVEGMLVGEVRELKIAPELAYGDRGAGGVIAPGATLIFEVEYFGTAGDGT